MCIKVLNWIENVISIRSAPLVIAMLCWAMRLSAQPEGEVLFKTTCAVCHKISTTRLIGPGLANVDKRRTEDWIISFVKSSQTVINNGDPYAVALFEKFNKMVMPDQSYTDQQIRSILSYIIANSPEETAVVSATGTSEKGIELDKPERKTTVEDILAGKNLFIGLGRLSNGGPMCNSCHHVNNDNVVGGLLAKNLTDAHERLTDAGIQAILGSPPFPAMKQAYGNNPITEDEIFQLTAFLGNAYSEQFYQHPRDYGQIMLLTGIIGAFILMGLFPALWNARKRNSVNKRIYDRQTKSSN